MAYPATLPAKLDPTAPLTPDLAAHLSQGANRPVIVLMKNALSGSLTIEPSKTGTIYVTITLAGPPGTVVSGNLYVDDFVGALPPYGAITGSELAALPYRYTIK